MQDIKKYHVDVTTYNQKEQIKINILVDIAISLQTISKSLENIKDNLPTLNKQNLK